MTATLPPVRPLTRGPGFHWFGYYDKLEFDPDGRYVLGMEVDFEHRSPRADDVIKVGMVDLKDGVTVEDVELALGEMCNVVKNTYGDDKGGFIAGQVYKYSGFVSDEGSVGAPP